MAEKEILEQNELIATRIPPGDNWELVIDQGTTIDRELLKTVLAFST